MIFKKFSQTLVSVIPPTWRSAWDLIVDYFGSESEFETTPKDIDPDASVIANLQALDTKKTVRTIKKTIGAVGVAGCDFNFATAANTTEQVIDLGSIIPAHARVLDIFTKTTTAFAGTGLSALVAETGSSSSGAEYIASATIKAAGAITQPAVGASFTLTAIAGTAGKVYVSATPTGANWAAVTAGKMEVFVTIIDITNV